MEPDRRGVLLADGDVGHGALLLRCCGTRTTSQLVSAPRPTPDNAPTIGDIRVLRSLREFHAWAAVWRPRRLRSGRGVPGRRVEGGEEDVAGTGRRLSRKAPVGEAREPETGAAG